MNQKNPLSITPYARNHSETFKLSTINLVEFRGRYKEEKWLLI
jgi:hypothetical protein